MCCLKFWFVNSKSAWLEDGHPHRTVGPSIRFGCVRNAGTRYKSTIWPDLSRPDRPVTKSPAWQMSRTPGIENRSDLSRNKLVMELRQTNISLSKSQRGPGNGPPGPRHKFTTLATGREHPEACVLGGSKRTPGFGSSGRGATTPVNPRVRPKV